MTRAESNYLLFIPISRPALCRCLTNLHPISTNNETFLVTLYSVPVLNIYLVLLSLIMPRQIAEGVFSEAGRLLGFLSCFLLKVKMKSSPTRRNSRRGRLMRKTKTRSKSSERKMSWKTPRRPSLRITVMMENSTDTPTEGYRRGCKSPPPLLSTSTT